MTPILFAAVLLSGSFQAPPGEAPPAADAVARGDALWQRRADSEGRPDARAVEAALAAYAEAVEARPEDAEARWKQLRSLHFQGLFVLPESPEAARRELWERGREKAEAALDLLAEPIGGREVLDGLNPEERAALLRLQPAGETNAAEIYFWSALVWGQWSDSVGRIKAARQGVGSRLRSLAETVVVLDQRIERAGGHRFLGRLHSEAPKIPLFTGWVDRDLAVEHLRRAVELAPDDPENAFFLAEALLDHHPPQRAEGLEILRRVAQREIRPDHRAEDTRTLSRVRQRLARESS